MFDAYNDEYGAITMDPKIWNIMSKFVATRYWIAHHNKPAYSDELEVFVEKFYSNKHLQPDHSKIKDDAGQIFKYVCKLIDDKIDAEYRLTEAEGWKNRITSINNKTKNAIIKYTVLQSLAKIFHLHANQLL